MSLFSCLEVHDNAAISLTAKYEVIVGRISCEVKIVAADTGAGGLFLGAPAPSVIEASGGWFMLFITTAAGIRG